MFPIWFYYGLCKTVAIPRRERPRQNSNWIETISSWQSLCDISSDSMPEQAAFYPFTHCLLANRSTGTRWITLDRAFANIDREEWAFRAAVCKSTCENKVIRKWARPEGDPLSLYSFLLDSTMMKASLMSLLINLCWLAADSLALVHSPVCSMFCLFLTSFPCL